MPCFVDTVVSSHTGPLMTSWQVPFTRSSFFEWSSWNVCPARTGPLEGPDSPSQDRDLPYLASFQVILAIVRQNCAKLGKPRGLQAKISPFSSHMRAGQTFPPTCLQWSCAREYRWPVGFACTISFFCQFIALRSCTISMKRSQSRSLSRGSRRSDSRSASPGSERRGSRRSPARKDSRSPNRRDSQDSRSYSRGRDSRSRSRDDSRSPRRVEARRADTPDYIKLTDADAAFILGKGGKTKEKIARVAGAMLDLPQRSMTLEITGPPEARKRAIMYVECVMAQRVGDVVLDEEDPIFKSDCTIVDVPSECAGFVTGRQGSFLRMVEEEYCTIMFFVRLKGESRRPRDTEQMAIFGERRGRRGAELKVMAAIESKLEVLLPVSLSTASFP